ncbi:MAG: glycosyltransferase [Pseudanabaenaceae cyanobacterium bins.68]|nr:glycosyltransferase [Pseudanabaenaceae cyanobacterium bins.68]
MRILFVAELSSHARAKQRLEALRDLGYAVTEISTVSEQGDRPSLIQRLRWKLGYPADLVKLRQTLPELAQEFAPDLIWIEKVLTLPPSTYHQLRQILPQVKIIFYSEDDIFLRHNRSVYLKRSLPLFDLVFTTKPRNLEELPKLGAQKVFCIYQAYDRYLHTPPPTPPQWQADVSFVGSFERDRAQSMLYLAKQGIKVKIWGSEWHRWRNSHPNLDIQYQAIYGSEFVAAIWTSKINLNFLRQLNRDRHTSRSLEIPACSGFMLTERTDEHQALFIEGKEAEFFASPAELLAKTKYYLANDSLREAIAQAGRSRCVTSGYSHHDRLQVMLAQLS